MDKNMVMVSGKESLLLMTEEQGIIHMKDSTFSTKNMVREPLSGSPVTFILELISRMNAMGMVKWNGLMVAFIWECGSRAFNRV